MRKSLALVLFLVGVLIATDHLEAARRPLFTVTTDNTPTSSTVVAETNRLPVATFTIHAWREGVTIDTLSLHNCIAETDIDGDCDDADETAGEDATVRSIRIVYTDSNGNTRRTSTTLTDGVATFSNLDLYVRKGATADVAAYANVAGLSDDVASGAQFQLNFNARTATLHGTGHTTKRAFTERDVGKNWVAEAMTVRNSTLAFSLAEDSPSGAHELGMQDVIRVTATANDGDAALSELTFTLDASDFGSVKWNSCRKLSIDTENYALTDGDGNVIDATWAAYDAAGTACASSRRGTLTSLVATFPEEHAIDAGSSRTYVLRVNTAQASASRNDWLRASLSDATWSDGTEEGAEISDGFAELPVEGHSIVF